MLIQSYYPLQPETYFCTPIKIDSDTDYYIGKNHRETMKIVWLTLVSRLYIVGFAPNATMETAHHMLVFGCEEPGSQEAVW